VSTRDLQELIFNSCATFFVLLATCLWADGLADARTFFEKSHAVNEPGCELKFGSFRFGKIATPLSSLSQRQPFP
jgi:hypothetical protein